MYGPTGKNNTPLVISYLRKTRNLLQSTPPLDFGGVKNRKVGVIIFGCAFLSILCARHCIRICRYKINLLHNIYLEPGI